MFMRLSPLFYSSNCTPGRPGQTQMKDWSSPTAAVWEGEKQLIESTWMGFFAWGNPNGIRNGDVYNGFWGGGRRTPCMQLVFCPFRHSTFFSCTVRYPWCEAVPKHLRDEGAVFVGVFNASWNAVWASVQARVGLLRIS